MTDPTDDLEAAARLTVAKYRATADRYQEAQQLIDVHRELIGGLEAEQAQLQITAQQCFATAGLLGFDLMEALNFQILSEAAPEGAVQTSIPAPAVPAGASGINVKQFVLDAAMAAYPDPVRAAPLRRRLKEAGRVVHEKTIGMTLYRLSREGLIRRDGFNWFYVHEVERDDDPPAPDGEASLFE